MMIEHARSSMAFAGQVSQLITVGLGFEDWEWGVTLWAANPSISKRSSIRCGSTKLRPAMRNSVRFTQATWQSASEILRALPAFDEPQRDFRVVIKARFLAESEPRPRLAHTRSNAPIHTPT